MLAWLHAQCAHPPFCRNGDLDDREIEVEVPQV